MALLKLSDASGGQYQTFTKGRDHVNYGDLYVREDGTVVYLTTEQLRDLEAASD